MRFTLAPRGIFFVAKTKQNMSEIANHFPTESEKQAVYRYCTKSRVVAGAKKKFAAERKPWNASSKHLREALLQKMKNEGAECYAVGDKYLRLQECKSYVALNDEIVSNSLFSIDFSKYENNVLGLVDELVNSIDEKRTRRKEYAKVMKTPPKSKKAVSESPPGQDILDLMTEYDEIQEKLQASRNREKEELESTKEEIKGLKETVNDYMVRVQLDSQRVNLPVHDKEVKGVAQTFFIRRKDRVVSKKITKKDLANIVIAALEGITLATFGSARNVVVQRILNQAQEFKEVRKDVSFDQGGLKHV
jgi:hypothetical protein